LDPLSAATENKLPTPPVGQTDLLAFLKGGQTVDVGIMKPSAGVKQTDPWGHYYIVCRWANPTNTDQPAIQVISAGPGGKLDPGTTCGAAVSTSSGNYAQMVNVASATGRASIWQTTAVGSTMQASYSATGVTVDSLGNLTVPGQLSLAGNLEMTGETASLTLSEADLVLTNGAITVGTGGISNGGDLTSDDAVFARSLTAANSSGTPFRIDATGNLSIGNGPYAFTVTAATGDTTVLGNTTIGGTVGIGSTVTIGSSSSTSTASLNTYGAVHIASTVLSTGTSVPYLSVGTPSAGIPVSYLFSVDQGGNVSAQTVTAGSYGAVNASSVNVSGALDVTGATTLGALTAGAANFGSVTASSYGDVNATSLAISGDAAIGGNLVVTGTINGIAGGGADLTNSVGIVSLEHGGTGTAIMTGNALDLLAYLGGRNASNLNAGTLNSALLPVIFGSGDPVGTYNAVSVDRYGRVTAVANLYQDTLGDEDGDSIGLASNVITFTINNTIKGIWNSTGLTVGSSSSPRATLDLGYTTDAMVVPVGTTGDEPAGAAATVGMIRYNSTTGAFEGYQGSTPTWAPFVSGSGSQWITSGSSIYYTAGNVGVGTIAPAQPLHVAGPIMIGSGSCGETTAGSIQYSAGGDLQYCNGTGWVTFASSAAENLIGAGSANYLAMFTGTNSLGTSALYQSSSNVGIGTTSPGSSLQVYNGIFEVQGPYNSGASLPAAYSTNGVGRMFFYPRKAALRAGITDSGQWNDANIGYVSVGLGENAKATGNYSIALGNAVASGSYSAAMGGYVNASGSYAVAMGGYSTASGAYSTALGPNSTASAYGETVIGRYNVGGGTAASWVDTDPVFEIGIGTGTTARANAVTVLKSGNVGIGTTSPTKTLQVYQAGTGGDDNKTIRNSYYRTDLTSEYYTELNSKGLNSSSNQSMFLKIVGVPVAAFNQTQTEFFTNGGTLALHINGSTQGNSNVGIGTTSPANTLDVFGTGIHIADGVPGTPTNSLYAAAGDLYWNGNPIASASGGWTGGTITVPYGGTGLTTLTQHGVMIGNGTDNINVTAAGTTGTVFQGVTGSDPVFSADLTFNGKETNPLGTDYTGIGGAGVDLGTSSSVRFAGTEATTVAGIANGADGRIIRLHNASVYTLTLANQDTGTENTEANRIITGTGANLPIPADTSVTMQYDGTTQRWRVTGSSNAAKALAAGSDTQVQFNDAGEMAGATGLIWDKANGSLGIGTTAPSAKLDVNGDLRLTSGASKYYLTSGSGACYDGQFRVGTTHCAGAATDYFLSMSSSGKVGVGVPATSLGSLFNVKGNVSIGQSFATTGATAAPENGLIVEGNVGVGTTGPSTPLHVVGAITAMQNGIGNSSVDGLVLSNTTAAADGAQQYSPRLRWSGRGWKTAATAGSQAVDFIEELRPMQGTTNPAGAIDWSASINGGSFNTVMTLQSSGTLEINGPASGSGVTLRVNGGGDVALAAGGTLFFDGSYNYATGSYIGPYSETSDSTDADTLKFTTSGIERLRIGSDGKIGIGTTAPVSSMHLATGGLFSVTGTYGAGDTLPAGLTGAGTRMFFYPRKGAFRAGTVGGTQWDDGDVGAYSFATGLSSFASGSASVAMGAVAIATGSYSVALGHNTGATSTSSTALGEATAASGAFSTAMGWVTAASGTASTAIGSQTAASGAYSLAGGQGTTAAAFSDVAIGRYNVGGGSAGSWVSTDPIFEIGIGADTSNRANAFTVLKNGNVGIGTATATNTLDVYGTGIHIADGVPGTPTNSLYAAAGDLYWNGNPIASGTGGWTGGTITVPYGGTGLTSLTQHGVMIGNGTDNISVTAAGATGTVFQGVTGSDPVFSADLTFNGKETNPLGTDYTTTGAQSGVNLGTSSSVRYAGAATATFYGIASGADGRIVRLHNASTYTLTLSNQSASDATEANRIITGTGADLPIPAETSVTMQYDAIASRWRVTGSSNAAKALAAGSDTQVQFNDAGEMAGASGLVYDKTTGRVGIGTTSPSSAFQVATSTNGIFSVVGTYAGGGDALNLSGAGARMFFYPNKAAFRAGYASAAQWDDANIGNISVAMGDYTTASANYSTAFGRGTVASAQYATAMGSFTTASGNVSTSLGDQTIAGSLDSVAMGRFNVGGGAADTWVATDPLFEIGIGTQAASRANAVTVLKSGSVGIGTTAPDNALVVASDATGPYLTNVQLSLSGKTNVNKRMTLGFDTSNNVGFIQSGTYGTGFNNLLLNPSGGSVGIGTTSPSLPLHVVGTSVPYAAMKIEGAGGTTSAVYTGQVTTNYGYIGSGYYHNSLNWRTASTAASNILFNQDGSISFTSNESLTPNTDYTPSTRMTITATGNVGIGTTNPAQALEVNGIAQADTAFYVGTGTGHHLADDNLIKPTTSSAYLNIKGGLGRAKLSLGDSSIDVVAGAGYYLTFRYGASSSTDGGTASMRYTATGGLSLGTSFIDTDPGTGNAIIQGNVGIGTTAPASSLHVATGGLFSVTGTYGSGDALPAGLTGVGTRMFFYPRKAAFRAGYAAGTRWDDTNIGAYSTVLGYNGLANGTYATAIGDGPTASGWASVAMGENTVASGSISTAMGLYTTAASYLDTVVGRYNVGGGTTSSWVATDPIFEIGIGADSGNRANAVTVLKSGNVGIGTATPMNSLDVFGTGIHIADGVPGTPTNSLYAAAGDLYWNGNPIASASGGWTGGTITVPYGGTGLTSLTQHGVMIGNGTDNINVTAAGATGTVFQGVTGSDPVFSADLTFNGKETNPLGTDYTTTGAQSGVNLGTSSSVRYAGAATATFYGIVSGADGRIVRLHNASTYTLTLSNQSASDATEANRIITGTGEDLPVPAETSVTMQYDATASRWRVTGSSNAAKALAAGSDTHIQYNDNGQMTGSDDLVFDHANARVGIGTTTPSTKLDVNGPVKVAGVGTETCDATQGGMMRYNPLTLKMEMCYRMGSPTGFAVSFTTTPIGTTNQTAAAFQMASAVIGDTYAYSITSSGGGGTVSGSGTVSSATQSVTGINVSTLGDGSLSLSLTLTGSGGTTDGTALAYVVKTTGDSGCSNPGDVCADGSIYAGTDVLGVLYTMPCDQGMTGTHNSCSGTRSQITWNDGSGTYGVQANANWTTGATDTTTLYDKGTSPSPAPYYAARSCRALGSAWYLPAMQELALLYTNRTAIGGFSSSFYFTTTEYTGGNSGLVYGYYFSDGSNGYVYKNQPHYVRCVRR
jgi:hypothetical protein